MFKIVESSKVVNDSYEPASKESQSRLDRLAQTMRIPYKELGKLAKEVIGREFGGIQRLTEGENRKLRVWLKENRNKLEERYREVRFK